MSNKKGKLSKAELYYIQENPDNLSEGDIAKELKRPIQVISRAVVLFKQNPNRKKKKTATIQQVVEPEVVESIVVEEQVAQVSKEPTMLSQLFGHDDVDKKRRREYAIMTPAAAEQSDVLKKADKMNKANQPHVFRPKEGQPSR